MERSTIIIGLIFVGLTLYTLTVVGTADNRFSNPAQDPTLSLEYFPDLIVEQAERIEIFEPDVAAQRKGEEGARKSIVLKRVTRLEKGEDDAEEEAKLVWTVESESGYPARSEKVEELLTIVDGFKSGNVRSRNPESHETLQVNALGKEVKIHDEAGAIVAHFYVGKGISGLKSTFVRKEGSDESVLVSGNIAPKLNTFRNNWLDNQILKFDFKLTSTIEIESAEHGLIRFEKNIDTGDWKVTKPTEFVADTRAVDSILRPMSVFRFLEITGPASKAMKEYGLDPPRLTMVITLSDGTEHKFIGGAQKDERAAYARIEGSDFVFEVSRYTLDKLDRNAENYRPKEKKAPEGTPPVIKAPVEGVKTPVQKEEKKEEDQEEKKEDGR